MSVLIDRDTRILIHGITGHQGTVHARNMREFGGRPGVFLDLGGTDDPR